MLIVANCAHLQEDLNLLYQWFVTWLMDFNPLKYKFLRITIGFFLFAIRKNLHLQGLKSINHVTDH